MPEVPLFPFDYDKFSSWPKIGVISGIRMPHNDSSVLSYIGQTSTHWFEEIYVMLELGFVEV